MHYTLIRRQYVDTRVSRRGDDLDITINVHFDILMNKNINVLIKTLDTVTILIADKVRIKSCQTIS